MEEKRKIKRKIIKIEFHLSALKNEMNVSVHEKVHLRGKKIKMDDN